MSFRLNPVSLPKGAHQDATDEFVFTSFPQFAVTRIIDTGQYSRSPLGTYHRCNLDIFIQDSVDGGYDYVDLTGIAVKFNKPDPQPGVQEKNASHLHLGLEPMPKAKFRLHDTKARTKTLFQKFKTRVWYPVEIEDASGLKIKIERSKEGYIERIIHPSGLMLEFQNTSEGTRLGFDLIGLEGTRLAVMRYRYDDQARLSGADAAFAKSWSYEYGQTSLTSDDGHKTRTTHVFDEHGRVIRVDTGDSYKQGQIAYHDDRNQITVTHGQKENGVFEKLWFDDLGRHFMSANPLGEISYREFDAANKLTAETDANGHKTSFQYDTYGNISSFIDPEKRETFIAFDDMGNVLVQKDPNGNAWRYEYDDAGQLVEVKDPLGHLTNIINNEYGQPVQVMRHDGLIEFREYDEHNQLTNIIDFNSQETIFKYDEFGRVSGIQAADKNITWLQYDNVRGKDFTTPTRITRPDGVEIHRNYHPTGTIKTLTDGEGRTTHYRYGPYDVLEEIVDPKGNTLTFQYDSQERLTCVTNQLGLRWTFERDTAGRVTTETDFDGRTLKYKYDPGGRVIQRDNPDGSRLEYDYDKSGLLTELRAFAPDADGPEITSYEYDEAGALKTAVNTAATIELERDALGRITAETTNGIRIESEIDCCGRRVTRTIGEQTVKQTYDGMGGLTKWQLNDHTPLTFAHDAVGNEIQRHSAHGFELTQNWDVIGQLTAQKSKGIGRQYDWSKSFEPTKISDNRWGAKAYSYDANGQITKTSHGDDGVEVFGYNKDLNLTATGDHDQFLNWQTSAAGVVKLARGPRGEVVKLEHDVCGRVVKRTVERKGFRPQTWTFRWNVLDQMVGTTTPEGVEWTYAYDPFGRRISKECSDAHHAFLWDGDVVASETVLENGHMREVDWFFEPESFRPLARSENDQLAYVVNDHLGTPKELVAEDGTPLWAADHDTWGTVRRCKTWARPNHELEPFVEDGTSWYEGGELVAQGNKLVRKETTPDPLLVPIRFQGQWEDAETGLFYNRHRYYEPLVGHYLCLDPLRFLGGTRQTGYAGVPNQMVDPYGLVATNDPGWNLYHIVRRVNGKDVVCYVGITKDVVRRRSEHQRSGLLGVGLEMVADSSVSNVTYATARGAEQADIEAFNTRRLDHRGQPVTSGGGNRANSFDPSRTDKRGQEFNKGREARKQNRGCCGGGAAEYLGRTGDC